MIPVFESLTNKLKDTFGVAVESIYEFRDEVTVSVKKEIIDEVCRFLHDNTEWKFDICEDVTAIDWYQAENRFEVVYHLFCFKHKIRLVLKVKVDERDCIVPTISSIYTGANWQEREVYDMFGIEFSDHPDLRRVYMPEDYEYFPLRKDFPLMGIPGSIPLPQR